MGDGTWNKTIETLQNANDAVLRKLGGEQAVVDSAAARTALQQGHIVDSFKNGLRADMDVVRHVTGYDKPLDTPKVAPIDNGKPGKSK